MKFKIYTLGLTLFFLFFSCATVSDSMISAISQEQYAELNSMYKMVLEYKFYGNENSLNKIGKKLDSIDLKEIYNDDYKAKIIGMKALVSFYKKNPVNSRILLKEIEQLNRDDEFYWIVAALLEKDKKKRLDLLVHGSEDNRDIDYLRSYLAESYLENEMYGESTAIFDSILVEKSEISQFYRELRDLAFLFYQNPPSSYESGLLISKNQIDIEDLINLIYSESSYFENFNIIKINDILHERKFFYDNKMNLSKPLLKKDLAYFIFALIADRNRSIDLWSQYDDFFIPNLSFEMKKELEGTSPILDLPTYKYYFYPALYLIEEEIMELPDGENFFPNQIIQGNQLLNVISNLKNSID